jgi:hypothetical protein
MTTHSLERTGAKGGPFIGRCVLCGRRDLVSPFHQPPCINPAGTSQDQALIDAIEGPAREGGEG